MIHWYLVIRTRLWEPEHIHRQMIQECRGDEAGGVWMDGVKEAVTNCGLTLEQARVTVHDRVEYRILINRD